MVVSNFVGDPGASSDSATPYPTALTLAACDYEGARHEFKGGDLFLGGKYIELGISPVGSFGTESMKPVGPPYNWYGTQSSSQVGMSVDYDGYNCGVENKRIDFFLPGTPEERWAAGYKVGGSTNYVGVSALVATAGAGMVTTEATIAEDTEITNQSSGSTLKATVNTLLRRSSDSSPVMRVRQTIVFGAEDQYFTNTVTLTNLSGQTWDEARFMRSFDPDNFSFVGGGTSTENRVLRTIGVAGATSAVVQAQGSISLFETNTLSETYDTRAPILFYSSYPTARGSTWGFSNSNVFDSRAWETPGTSTDSDIGMSMTFRKEQLAAGESVTFVYVTSLDLRDFAVLEEEIVQLQQQAEQVSQGTPAPSPGPSSEVGDSPAASPAVQTPTPTVIPRPRRTPLPLDLGVVQAPILQGSVPSPPPAAPTASLGGRLVPIQTQVTSPTGFSLIAGVLNLGVQVQQNQGVVRQNNAGGTEIEVRKGSSASMTGTGLLPRSTVQVFLPLQGANAKEIARIRVDEAGTFSGEAVFATRTNERPLPIGRQLLQVVSLDEEGNQAVLEMAVNIAQPPPAPEPSRTTGVTPTLRPGQVLATNAGEPEIVTVVPLPQDRQARVEGDGWQMAVDIPSTDGAVTESADGGALLQLVRDETALVSGSGFMPGTRADVWLFSEPTLLGTVDIDENGEFTGEVNIDANVVTLGEHTLQLQGVGEDGYVRAANLGVVVNDTASQVLTEESAGGLLWWFWLIVLVIAVVIWVLVWRFRRTRDVVD